MEDSFTCQSTEAFQLSSHWNHPTPQLDNYYFPLFPHWKGSLIHMFLIHLHPTHHNGIGEGNGNPLQRSCLENPRDGGALWAAIYGVAQSQTRLKRLSSSSMIVLFLIL